MNKDQVKGSVKEAAGKLVGNRDLEAEGKVDKSVGKVQAKVGDLKADFKDAVRKA